MASVTIYSRNALQIHASPAKTLINSFAPTQHRLRPRSTHLHSPTHRSLQSSSKPPNAASPFAFAFDIDGVLLRSSSPLPGAANSLKYLQQHRIPFILLTNGGGKSEEDRVREISHRLGVDVGIEQLVQSHTPFKSLLDRGDISAGNGGGEDGASMDGLRDRHVLVTGGDAERCRKVAEGYGFRSVITPADIFTAYPTIWPFRTAHMDKYYASHARPLPLPLYTHSPHQLAYHSPSQKKHLQLSSILVFNDPHDWAMDIQLILDLLFSHRGFLGTLSPLNGDKSRPNEGWQQDGQPSLWFSNPDLWWAASWHLNRLGQGAFREAVEGVWRAATGGVELQRRVVGKPHGETYAFAETMLDTFHRAEFGRHKSSHSSSGYNGRSSDPNDGESTLKRVFMIGDNPASDIHGANSYRSALGSEWISILVRTGVYQGGEPAFAPKVVVDGVWDAVRWALAKEGWADAGELRDQ